MPPEAPSPTSSNAPLISVVVPVYNVEPYIGKCLESLVGQSMQELEFIIVDDCGTDNSMDIARQYAEQDARIRLLPGDRNRGVAHARNRGMEAARGEYIGFIDSDDWLSQDYYKLLYEKACAEQADIAKGTFCRVTGDKVVWSDMNEGIRQCQAEGLFTGIAYTHIYCNSIYRAEMLRRHGITFPPLTNGEDLVFLIHALLCANKLVLEDRSVYHYVQHPHSASRRISTAYYDSVFEQRRMVGELISRSTLSTKSKIEYWHRCLIQPLLKYHLKLARGVLEEREFYVSFFARIKQLLQESGCVDELFHHHPEPLYRELLDNSPEESVEALLAMLPKKPAKKARPAAPSNTRTTYRLFGFLPLLTIRQSQTDERHIRRRYLLFGFLPVWKWVRRGNGTSKHYLLSFIPLRNTAHP